MSLFHNEPYQGGVLDMRIFIKTFLVLVLASTLGLSLYRVLAQGAADKVVLRDGREITGRLNSLDETFAQFNGKSIERSQVKLIRFADATNALPEEVFEKDLVMRRDNSRSSGFVTLITDRLVIQNGVEIKRADVALIRLADNLHTVSAVPKGSPTPSLSVSPTPTPGETGEDSPAGNSDNSKNNNNSKNNSDEETGRNPPWFNTDKKCNNKQRTFIFAGGYGTSDGTKTLCFLYIHVCSLQLRRNIELPPNSKCPVAKDFAQPTFCCDEFNKAAKSKQGCDPMKDADCDGTPNEQDRDPLNPKKH